MSAGHVIQGAYIGPAEPRTVVSPRCRPLIGNFAASIGRGGSSAGRPSLHS